MLGSKFPEDHIHTKVPKANRIHKPLIRAAPISSRFSLSAPRLSEHFLFQAKDSLVAQA
jgi:hypothetical protein